ncbi:response regulator [Urechidicola croceus]|uniref:Response regulator n=1 Tax=Urechidicola croceus TaxID=1850246 RepID=A0A1D8P3X3_9FLAO|nr:response regulator [Urechidicola croceus]AOW19293.1 response regulator [Urechidicola croceus]
MKKKLECILLIDDDEAVNFVHTRVIKKLDCANEVHIAKNGLEALEFLKSKNKNGENYKPNLIFLDINMPIMNGWEFLKEYNKLESFEKGDIVLMMLTSSLNPDDYETANKIPEINGFMNKPMTVKVLEEIINKNFM